MGEQTEIQWCHHTFNPWIGCEKVAPECWFCYAEALMDHRHKRVQWGRNGTRDRTSKQNWRNPRAWNRQAEADNVRRRVFCASLADIFEDRPELTAWREDLFQLIDDTPQLDWLLLTKRPRNIERMWLGERRRDNVWLGTSAGSQETIDRFVPQLVRCRHLAPILFLSVEPLIGQIESLPLGSIDWCIIGGESGRDAREMKAKWALGVMHQCQEAGVPVFMKQLGKVLAKKWDCKDTKGGNLDEWPKPLCVREFPNWLRRKVPQVQQASLFELP